MPMRAGARRRITAAVTPRARWRRPALAAGLTAAVAAGVAAAVVLASGSTPDPASHLSNVVTAAWTVRENANGTVTIDVRQLADPARLQQVLRDDGINAFVRPLHWAHKGKLYYPVCTYAETNRAPRSVQQAVLTSDDSFPPKWVINPSAMPAGTALFVSGGPVAGPHGQVKGVVLSTKPVVLNNNTLPACVPFTPAKP